MPTKSDLTMLSIIEFGIEDINELTEEQLQYLTDYYHEIMSTPL